MVLQRVRQKDMGTPDHIWKTTVVAVYKVIIVYKNDYGDIADNTDLKILQMSENIK